MQLVRVRRPKQTAWHYAIASEVRPVCACLCKTPGVPRKRGGGLCACHCHKVGLAKSLTLCEKLARKNGRLFGKDGVAQVAMFDSHGAVSVGETGGTRRMPLKVVTGRGAGCQTCSRLGAKLNKDDVEWLQKELAGEQ